MACTSNPQPGRRRALRVRPAPAYPGPERHAAQDRGRHHPLKPRQRSHLPAVARTVSTPPARRGAGTEPGELGASDLRLVNDLHEFVVTTRGRWREEPTVPIAEAPPVVVDGPAGNAHLDDTIDFDSDAGEQTPGKLDDDVRTVRGDRLTPLTLAEIEVDGRPTTVVITEIEPDRRSPSPRTLLNNANRHLGFQQS